MKLLPRVLLIGFASVACGGVHASEPFAADCADCHGRQGEGNDRLRVPAIAGLPDYYVVQQLTKFKEHLRGFKSENKKVKNMHASAGAMDEGAMRVIAQAVAAMRPAPGVPTIPGDSGEGKVLYEKHCAECHGSAAEGNAAKESPPLHGFQDWYLEAQIREFRAGERKADHGNVDSVRMHQMARQLRRKKEIRNLVRFIDDQLSGELDANP